MFQLVLSRANYGKTAARRPRKDREAASRSLSFPRRPTSTLDVLKICLGCFIYEPFVNFDVAQIAAPVILPDFKYGVDGLRSAKSYHHV